MGLGKILSDLMPSLSQIRTIKSPAKSMYELVMDIEKYPEFLPWCKQAKIIEVLSPENLRADLLINFKSFFEKYRSDVKHGKLGENSYFIDVVAIEGPFKKLVTKWIFKELEDQKSCEVEFFIEFEFSSILLSKMIGMIFESASKKMINAFEERAKAILI